MLGLVDFHLVQDGAAACILPGQAFEVVGKPQPAMFEAAMRRLDCRHPIMVGDSLHSDVAGAAAAGMATALVLTGRDSREDVGGAPHAPDLVFASLEELALTLA